MSDVSTTKKKSKTLAFSTIIVMIGLVFSKGSGFVRDIIVGYKFNELYCDAYSLSFIIPDLVFKLLVGGSIQAAVTPSLAASLANNKEKEGMRTVSIFISVVATIMFVVCTISVIFSEQIFSFYSLFNDKKPETIYLASKAAQMLFPQIFFMMLAALCIGILNAYKRFGSTSFGPTIYNVFVLLSILIFAGNDEKSLVRCTAGIMVAAIIYFLFQYIIGFDKLKQIRFIFKPTDKSFIKLLKTAIPVLISSSIVQVNQVVLNTFALSLPEDGQIFALRNADTIWQLPYGIFAVAVGSVMLPSLASLYSEKKYSEASELLSSRLKTALFMSIPSAGFLLMCNSEVFMALFPYSRERAQMAGTFLIGYSFAVITHTVVFIMNQAFYAIGKTKIPLLAGAISLISNPLICYALMKNGYGALSLTIAYSSTSLIQLLVLCIFYCRRKELAPRNMVKFILKSIPCLGVMCLVLFILNRFLPLYDSKIKIIMILAVKGIVAVIAYFGMAIVMKTEESKYWINTFKSKILRK